MGIGAGWITEETEIMGGNFPRRWAQCRESVLAMKELWTTVYSEYHGEFYDFPQVVSFPRPVQRPPPARHPRRVVQVRVQARGGVRRRVAAASGAARMGRRWPKEA